jgi:glutathione S-transferase
MITLWGRANSVNVRKVWWALEEMGLPYQRVDAGREFGVVGDPAYRAMNPNGLIPTIRDGDLILWESNAILRYLAARHGGARWFAVDPVERARVDQWMDWQQTELNKAMGDAFVGLVRTPPDQRDHAAIEASRAATERRLAVLDAALEGREWLRDDFGLAELALGPHVFRWMHMPVAREPHPHVERWCAAFSQRPAARAALTTPIT